MTYLPGDLKHLYTLVISTYFVKSEVIIQNNYSSLQVPHGKYRKMICFLLCLIVLLMGRIDAFFSVNVYVM
jgi:hypothetical protein